MEDLRRNNWVATCVPQPHHYIDNAFNVGAVFDAPPATFPAAPPPTLTPTQICPPRGICSLLPAHLDRAPPDTLEIDIMIAQEYYLHVLHAYASNGKACVDEATVGLPIPFPSVYLLVELIMSQILLPAPTLLVFAYHSIMVRLVEVVGQPVALCAPPPCSRTPGAVRLVPPGHGHRCRSDWCKPVTIQHGAGRSEAALKHCLSRLTT